MQAVGEHLPETFGEQVTYCAPSDGVAGAVGPLPVKNKAVGTTVDGLQNQPAPKHICF